MFSRETYLKLTKISYFLFGLTLFFPLRHTFFTKSAYLTGSYSDFTSFSLYLSDILIIITWLLIFLPRGENRQEFYHVVKKPAVVIIYLILALIWHLDNLSSLNLFFLLKYAELVVAYGTSVVFFKKLNSSAYFYWLFAIFSAFQSILAIVQFAAQKSLGLKYLGEGVISSQMLGVAKIVSDGTTYIRSYGTFPHPNILAAFLCFSLIIGSYLLIASQKTLEKNLLYALQALNLLGLLLSFSRSGYLATLLGLGVLLWLFWSTGKKALLKLFLPILLMGCIAAAVFQPLLLSRNTISDTATRQRLAYNEAGIKMFLSHPFSGAGAGESVLHMEQYMGKPLQPWEKQPVHNFFLLSAAELGIFGFLALLWLILEHFAGLISSLKTSRSRGEVKLFLAIFAAMLLLMQFDHYFYTLQQTQLLLWLILAAAASHDLRTEKNQAL